MRPTAAGQKRKMSICNCSAVLLSTSWGVLSKPLPLEMLWFAFYDCVTTNHKKKSCQCNIVETLVCCATLAQPSLLHTLSEQMWLKNQSTLFTQDCVLATENLTSNSAHSRVPHLMCSQLQLISYLPMHTSEQEQTCLLPCYNCHHGFNLCNQQDQQSC